MKTKSHLARLALAGLAVLHTLAPAHAATRYWDGGSVDIAGNGNAGSEGGAGTWNLSTKNWDRGATTYTNWVNAANDTAEFDTTNATYGVTLGANVTVGGINQKVGASGVSIAEGAGPFTLTLGITGNNTFSPFANDTVGRSLNINAVIAGATGKNLLVAGPGTSGTGTLTLGRANTFAGTTSFSAGATGGARVLLKHQLALQNSTVILSADASLIFDSSVAVNAFTFGGLVASSAGPGFDLALTNNAGTPIALTVGNNDNSTVYEGVLSGTGSLIKTGSGTLTLSDVCTYTGTTTVNQGELQLDGSTVSATTVNTNATLSGSGRVRAGVTVGAGGTLTAGDGKVGSLTVSNLTFSGPGTVNVGALSGYTGTAAIIVSNLLTVGGGTGAVTFNLPTALAFNGTYHLIRFASGIANTNGFKLGTVPTLAGNQAGKLQVNGNYLDYVISGAGDVTPPVLMGRFPANNSSNALPDTDLVATFNETVVPGTGSIELRRSSNGSLVESFNVTSSSRLSFSMAQLLIQPTNILASGQYYVVIPVGAVRDTSSNNFAGITSTNGWRFTVPTPVVLYTDTGSPTNPPWIQISNTIVSAGYYQLNYPGPVYGSAINVNNAAVEVGLYGNRPIVVPNPRIHVSCNTGAASLANFTRWFQTDGNTHVLRVFVDDENTATSRPGPSEHNEAYMGSGWNYTDDMTYEWTAHYTIAYLRQGYCAFQLKNTANDWAVQLSISGTGRLTVNNRIGADVTVTNADGTAKYFNGSGFDVRVLDDGLNYKLWVDGVLYANGSYSRPTGTTTFRWGMYFGPNNLNPPADYNLVLVSGVQIKSWPGTLATATSAITKANNTTSLDTGSSWVGGTTPGLYNQAVWNSTVAGANTTTLGSDQTWAGIKIVNPGGLVTINGPDTLSLDASGVDMSAATTNLVVNCPVQLPVSNLWNIAAGRTASFNGSISGYPGLTKSGGGNLLLSGANTFGGDTIVSNGTLVANNNLALSTGLLLLNGGSLSNTASCALDNDVELNASATVGVAASQTLTLNGVISGTNSLTKTGPGTLTLSGLNSFTGPTTVNAGTLAVGNTLALLSTPSLTLSAGTQLQPNLDGVIISAPITVASSGTNATISAPTNTPGAGIPSMLTLNSVLAGSGQVIFSSSAAQNALSTVYLGGQSTYAGGTKLDTAATNAAQIILKLGAHNALPTNTVLTIDGQVGTGTGRFAELNLNGFSQTLAGLTNIPRSLRIQRIVNSDISAPATLTINNSSNFTFSGNLGSSDASGSVATSAIPGSTHGNNFSLLKQGSGTLNLTGTNSYIGTTTVSNGTLALAVAALATNSTVTIASGAVLQLNFTGTNRVAALVLNGVPRANGMYNSTTAAPFLTGAGSLQVIGSGAGGPSGPATLTNSYSSTLINLSWPAGQGWRLEYQTNGLTRSNWLTWLGSTATNAVTIPRSQFATNVFFRLAYP